jgi:biopolymer transport protein ExbD
MKFKNPRHRGSAFDGTLPMTSMIDVVFLLLIFFMVTASMSAPESDLGAGLQVDQDGSSTAADLQPQIVLVEMGPGGPVYQIGDRAIPTKPELVSVLSQLPKDAGVFVRVSNLVPVEWAAAALQACKDAGFTKVTYVPKD